MRDEFLKEFLGGQIINEDDFIGYEDDELDKISRLYNLTIDGQIKSFLKIMGKSDGGVIGDSMIQLYRPSWKVREHLIFQVDFFNQMQEEGFYDYLNQPFVFSLVSETQYYFIQTSLNDLVYHYDSNLEEVKATEWDLVSFLRMLARENDNDSRIKSVGNLLDI